MDIYDETIHDTSPGLRINNPGDVRHPTKGGRMRGAATRQPHRVLVAFEHAIWGIRALAMRETRNVVPGVTTLGAMFANPAISLAGFTPDTVYVREAHLAPMIAAVIERRAGWQPYTHETIDQGCRLVN